MKIHLTFIFSLLVIVSCSPKEIPSDAEKVKNEIVWEDIYGCELKFWFDDKYDEQVGIVKTAAVSSKIDNKVWMQGILVEHIPPYGEYAFVESDSINRGSMEHSVIVSQHEHYASEIDLHNYIGKKVWVYGQLEQPKYNTETYQIDFRLTILDQNGFLEEIKENVEN